VTTGGGEDLRKTLSFARKVARRAAGLPRGRGFLRYARNRIAFTIAVRGRRPLLPHLTSLMLEVTNMCQLKCITCPREYALGQAMDKGHMDLGAAKRLVDDTHLYLDSLGLTGLGETLLYPHLVELVRHIRSRNKGVHIFISTNAQQPDAATLVEAIADSIDALQISIDGIGEGFEAVRRNSNWDKYVANVSEIVKVTRGRRARPKFNMVVLKENASQMPEVVRLAGSLGIGEVHFNTMNLVANDWPASYYAFYRSPEYRQAVRETREAARREGVIVGFDDITSPRSFKLCPFPWNHFYVTWDGFLVPCCAKPFPKEKHFGNVFEAGVPACLNSEAFLEFRRMAREGVTPAFCRRCNMVTEAGEARPGSRCP
jgi:radical SAM protein with 4Fe4S-binding SPASM domain